MTEDGTRTGEPTLRSRLAARLRATDPSSLGLLGLLSLPGYLSDRLAFTRLFGLFFLFFLWPLVAPLGAAVRRRFTGEQAAAGPRDWLEMGGWREYAAFLCSLSLTFLNPLAFVQDLLQLAGGGVAFVRHRGSFPAPPAYEQSASYRLPVDGTWTVVNGSPLKDHSHSWVPVTQRYAYDLVVTDDAGRTRPEGASTRVERYYCHDRPVVAPADGVVVEVCDSDPEFPWAGGFSHPLKRSITGNYVVIQHAAAEYSTLAHLVPGSVAVAAGDRVERGQQVARCGHTGNSSEPHLHFQVQDHPSFEFAAGLPVAFDDVAVDAPGVDVAAEVDWTPGGDGRDGRYVHLGQRVTHEVDAGDSPDERGPATDERDPAVEGHDSATDERDPADAAPAPASTLPGAVALGRAGVGVAVGGVLAVVGGILASSLVAVAALLAGAAAVAVCYRSALLALREVRPRTGSLGAPAGLALAAAAVGALATATPGGLAGPWSVGGGLFLGGFLVAGVAWEYRRRRLADAVGDASSFR